MVDQSLKRGKSGQSLKRSSRSIRGRSYHRGRESRSRSNLTIWLGLLACLIALAAIPFVIQLGRRPRVYDDVIFIKRDTQSSGASTPDVSTPKKGSNSENTGHLEGLIRRIKPSVVFIDAKRRTGASGQGSGFVIGRSGYVLTCHHIVEGANRVTVSCTDARGKARRASASLVWAQENRDIALICVDRVRSLAPIELGDAEGVGQGHQIIAIGYPLGSVLGIELTVTTGIISSIRQISADRMLFQISAAVNPGNSGGALVSVETGRVIGIVNAKISNAEGIGFAIPITHNLKRFLTKGYIR